MHFFPYNSVGFHYKSATLFNAPKACALSYLFQWSNRHKAVYQRSPPRESGSPTVPYPKRGYRAPCLPLPPAQKTGASQNVCAVFSRWAVLPAMEILYFLCQANANLPDVVGGKSGGHGRTLRLAESIILHGGDKVDGHLRDLHWSRFRHKP